MPRPRERDDWRTVWLGVASSVAMRSSCSRDQVGAVLVVNDYWTFVGYNGPASGRPNCDIGGCPRGLLTTEQLPHGARFEGAGLCEAVHAEINAVMKYLRYFRQITPDVMLYTTREPCEKCWDELIELGFMRDQIVWSN